MGVRGLQSYMESHCSSACYNVNLAKLSVEYQKRTNKMPLIVVDGMSCLRKLYGKLNWICGGQWLGYIDHIKNFVKSLQGHGYKLVFFFDGNTPERKRETWIHRRVENLKDVTNYFLIIKMNKELEHGKHFFLPTGLAAFTPLILKDVVGCEVYTCEEECDKGVAEYAKRHGAIGILGQDSDYTIYSTAHYYFSINHLNLETLDTIVYDRSTMARTLQIGVDQLPLLSCLIGNDIIQQDQLLNFHKMIMSQAHFQPRPHSHRLPPEILIPRVANFIHNQPPMSQMMHQLPQLARAVFRDEGMVPALVEGMKMYQLDTSGPDQYQPIPEETIKNTKDIMDRIAMRHLMSELGRHLYSLMRGAPYESSTTLEDYSASLPSGALVFRPLRARTYRILLKSVKDPPVYVEEWCMYNGNTLEAPDRVQPEELLGGSSSIEELWNGDEELKWRTLCDCVHPDLHDTRIRNLRPCLVIPTAILFFLQCTGPKPILKEWEANAMIALFVSPIRRDLNLIRAVNLPRIDARAVHFAAIFMKGVVNMYLLNAACNFPVKRENAVPWDFWDGKVFHHFYLRAKLGARIDDLCNHKEDQLQDFQEIKSMIAAHTPVVPPPTRTPAPTTSRESTPKGSPKKTKSRHATPSPSSSPAHSPPVHPPQPPTSLNIAKPNYSSGSPRISPRGSPSSPRSPHISGTGKRAKSPAMGVAAVKSPSKKAANGPPLDTAM